MKLKDIYVTCKDSYNYFNNLEVSDEHYSIEKLNEDKLQQLINMEFLHHEVVGLLDKSKNFSEKDSKVQIILEGANEEAKRALLTSLIQKLECIVDLCETIGVNTEETLGLDVKLPECKSLTDLKKTIGELEFIFTKCPFFQYEDAYLEFRNIDIGSIWLNLVVVAASIKIGIKLLSNIADFIDKCIIIKSHYLTYLQQKKEIEKAEIDEAEKQEMLKYIEKMYKIVVDNAIRELEESTGRKMQDGDERGRTEQAINKIEKLIDKGLQIYSTIDSPKEAKALFEPIKTKFLDIEEELKLIEKGKKSE